MQIKMEKTRYYLAIGVFLLVLASCNDFLQENPKSSITQDKFFTSSSDAYSAVNVLYRKGFMAAMNSGSYSGCALMYSTGYRTGLIDNPVGRGNNMFITRMQQLNVDSITDGSTMQGLWSNPYEVIVRNANYAIENLSKEENCPGLTEAERKQLLGEAHFFRALNYFYLVRIFGPVPIILNYYVSLEDLYVKRSSEKLVYKQIMEDLDIALAAGLPDKPMPENGFRISRASVLALAADICMNMAGFPVLDESKYALAAKYSKELINNSAYALIQHGNGFDAGDVSTWDKSAYNTLRTSDNQKEYLFVKEYDATISNANEQPTWCLPFEAVTWNVFKYPVYINAWHPDPILHAAYDENDDLRFQEKQYFHSSYTEANGTIHTFDSKYAYFWWEEEALLSTQRAQKDICVYRLGEMYLTAAEAIVRSGNAVTDEAAGYLATIKARASLNKDYNTIFNEVKAITDPEAFVEEVLAEKIRETLFEFKLWTDIARTRKYPAIVNGKFGFVPLIGATNPFGSTYTVNNLYFPLGEPVAQRNPLLAESPLTE
jgi:hypothetical protein